MDLLGLVDVPVWLMLLIILVLTLYMYGTWNHTMFKSLGIPGPKPLPFFGNAKYIEKKGFLYALTDWREEYGHVYGIFFALKPMLVVSDLDIVKEVLVKDFNNFADRFFTANIRPPIISKGLFFTGGQTWKRLRRLMTPTFTAGKLKNMSHFIDRCADILKDGILEKTKHKEVIEIKDVFGAFTMDVIAGTAFGLETNFQTQTAEPFVQNCKNMLSKLSGSRNKWLTIAGMFPFLTPLIIALGKGVFTGEESNFLVHSVYRMVDERRQAIGDEKRTDFLQLLVNAEDTGLDIGQKRMTREEVAGQGFLILIAGYETTATTLQYLTYNLAKNQDVQQRVYEEMTDELGDEDPTYDNVGRLKYLDNVIHETLRLFPPVSLITRQALQSRTFYGVNIPAGMGVAIPIYSIMHDPDYFDDPEKFWPERFNEAESSKLPSILTELAFGYGPRQCIGMRLALLEIKFAAVRILRHFRFLPSEDTRYEEGAGQGVIILIAGYETTATTLQYLTYSLAKNQDVQQRVYEEMRDELGDEDPTYDNVGRPKYLDNVIHETLRLFPPVPFITRQVLQSRTIKGVTIPAGVGVYVPIYSIMHDSDYFDDPEKFWPERYSEGGSSKLPSILLELAFGYGPRQCIGMRLALLEIKFAAVRILRHFRFLPNEDTPDKIEFVTSGISAPKKPLKLRTQLRV